MFRQFHDLLETWFKELGILNFLTQESNKYQINKPFQPTSQRVWRAFLKQVLPFQYTSYSPTTDIPFTHLVERLSDVGSYITTKTMLSLINDSFLQFVPLEEQQKIEQVLRKFQRTIPTWINGDFHEKISNHPLNAMIEIKDSSGIEDNWACASFLAELGFDFPHSKGAYQVWKNWSGLQTKNCGYQGWLENLISLQGNLHSAKATDFIWNVAFSENQFLPLPKLCMNHESCKLCPLEKECKHRSLLKGSQHNNDLQGRIQFGEASEISTKDLIVYLLSDRWRNSSKQQEVIDEFPDFLYNESFPRCEDSSEEELRTFLLGVRELAQRFNKTPSLKSGKSFTSSQEIFEYFQFSLAKERQETFHTLILNNLNQIIQLKFISKGTLTQSLVHPREVFAPALQLRAAAIVLIHNHPSGDPLPSSQDIEITKRLCKAGQLVGIKVLDHVIVGQNQYYSFIDEDIMPEETGTNSF